jgi:hypothetical protein
MYNRSLRIIAITIVLGVLAAMATASDSKAPAVPSAPLPEFNVDTTSNEVLLVRDGKLYKVNLDAGTITAEGESATSGQQASSSSAPAQSQMPAQPNPSDAKTPYYTIGDVRMVTLPTTKTLPKHGMLVDFTHRFPFQPTFSGPALGHSLLGLDSFAIPSFGFDYGVTDRLSIGVFRSPTIINRPIEFKAGVKLADEAQGQPLSAVFRFTVAGQNDFTRDYTESFELIAAKSLGSHAQIEVVPTFSVHNRPITFNVLPQPCGAGLANGFDPARNIHPCSNTFSIGVGLSVDVRPTVALLFEVDPTAVGGPEVGIHHAPYSIGIQKKIWRHAFMFGFTNSPGVTTAQRIFPRSVYVQEPNADRPSALFIGFNLTRQLR